MLDDDDLKALWKEHFARQITVNERTIMKTFQSAHLGTADVAKISKLSDGKFDDTVLYRLTSVLTTSFESYNPDNAIMTYLKQHAQALRWEHKLDFRPPREKERSKTKTKIRKTVIRRSERTNPAAKQIVTHPHQRE